MNVWNVSQRVSVQSFPSIRASIGRESFSTPILSAQKGVPYVARINGAINPGGIPGDEAVDAPVLIDASLPPSSLDTSTKAVAPIPSATARIRVPSTGGEHHLGADSFLVGSISASGST